MQQIYLFPVFRMLGKIVRILFLFFVFMLCCDVIVIKVCVLRFRQRSRYALRRRFREKERETYGGIETYEGSERERERREAKVPSLHKFESQNMN